MLVVDYRLAQIHDRVQKIPLFIININNRYGTEECPYITHISAVNLFYLVWQLINYLLVSRKLSSHNLLAASLVSAASLVGYG